MLIGYIWGWVTGRKNTDKSFISQLDGWACHLPIRERLSETPGFYINLDNLNITQMKTLGRPMLSQKNIKT